MSGLNYYEHHLGDYAKDTAHLSMVEHGAYRLLLDRYYSTGEAIPADQAYRVARARSREERAAVEAVLGEFFTLTDGRWHNSRADAEITKAQAKINAAQTNGKKGGRPKKNPDETKQKPSGFSTGSENKTQTKAHQTPNTKHQTPVNRHTESISPLRDDFVPADWEAWRVFFEAEHGVEADPYSHHDRSKLRPLAAAWVNARVTVGQMRRAIAQAQAQAKEPIAYLPGYVDRVLASLRAEPGPSAGAMLLGLHSASQSATPEEPDYIDMED